MRDRPKVGEILVQAGIIDEDQLATALGEQTRWGRRLGMTLIKLGMVQEGHLVRALAKQFDLPVASLAGKKIAPDVIALVPAKVAREHGVIPLFVKNESHKAQLFLGMEEPSDLGVLDDLAFRTGMAIRPVMVGPTEIGEAIDRYYNHVKPAAAAPKLPDPEQVADTLSETNLRRVREEVGPSLSQLLKPGPMMASSAPRPIESRGTETQAVPGPQSAPRAAVLPEIPLVQTAIPLPTAPAPDDEVTSPVLTLTESASAETAVPSPATSEPGASSAATGLAFEENVARALEETERTRLVAKAIAHLLIEKGILTLEELQARIEKMRVARPGSST